MNGALIQKELAAPHNDWWTTSRPLSQGSLTPDDTVGKIFQRLVDADELASLVRAGTQRLAASPGYRKALQERSMQEQLRPLFCPVELNIVSDPDPSDDQKPTIQIPQGFFADPRLGELSISIPRANYDRAVEQRRLQLPPGRKDADHPWLTPVKANSDMVMVNSLVEMGVIDNEFVADVLAVDFINPLFSSSRCGLLTLVPEKGGPDFLTRFQTALKASSKPAAKELLDNLTDPKRDATFHRQQAAGYLNACLSRASQPEAASEWLDVLVQRRAAVETDDFSRHPRGHITESPDLVVFPSPADSAAGAPVGSHTGLRSSSAAVVGSYSLQPGQHLLGQQHKGLVAERRAQEIVEADLRAQPQDLVADFVRRAVQDHLVEIAPDRVYPGRRKASLHNRPVLGAEIGIEDPFGAIAGDVPCLAGIVGDRHQAGDRDVAPGLGKPGSCEFLRVVPALGADLRA